MGSHVATTPPSIDAPEGTVTMLLTDVEDSTPLLQRFPAEGSALLLQHRDLLRTAFAPFDGYEVSAGGEETFYAFSDAASAVNAALAGQQALASHPWPAGGAVRVRMGLHTGTPARVGSGYIGLDIHRCARIAAAGYGGQVLLSEATHTAVRTSLQSPATLVDLGLHRFKGLAREEHIFQAGVDGAAAHFPQLRSLPGLRSRLPMQPTRLIGRESELAELATLMARRDVRLVTLTGPGGVGKSRLALEAAAHAALLFTEGACFVPLAPVRDAAAVAPAIARALSLSSSSDSLDAVVEYLRDRQLLLLLDNFEQVLDAAPIVAELLAGSAGLKVVATSREPLRLRAEREFPVSPLDLPGRSTETAEIARSSAVRLFVERAAAVRPGIVIGPDNAAAIGNLCTRLDGLPLAIELVAARSRLLPPEELLVQVEASLDLAIEGARDMPERHRSLRAAISWSYDLLPEEEQALLRRVATFAGSFTAEAAAALSEMDGPEDTLGRLDALAGRSLVEVAQSPAGPRFALLETIREYGIERLEAAGEAHQARSRHLDWFRRWAVRSNREGGQVEHVARIESEIDNMRAALAYSLTNPAAARSGLTLAISTGDFWWQRQIREGTEWLRKTLSAVPQEAEGQRSTGLFWLAFLRSYQERSGDLLPIGEECVALARKDKRSPAPLMLGLNLLANLLAADGRMREALLAADEAEELADGFADQAAAAIVRGGCGRTRLACGDLVRAEHSLGTSLATFREFGAVGLLPSPLAWMAILRHWQGEDDEAERLVREALDLLRRTEDGPRLCSALALLASIRVAQGRQDEASRFARESLAAAAEFDFPGQLTWALAAAAELATGRDDHHTAAVLFAAAANLACGDEAIAFSSPRMLAARARSREALGTERSARAESEGRHMDRLRALEFATAAASHDD